MKLLLTVLLWVHAQVRLQHYGAGSVASSGATVSAPVRRQPFPCGMTRGSQVRITAGSDVSKGQAPWQANLVFPNDFVFCSGSIVSENIVVTAAHCVRVFDTNGFQVVVWRQTRSPDPEQVRLRVAEIIMHPDYIPFKNKNDIAVLRLEGSMQPLFESGTAGPICLPQRRCIISDPASCLVGKRGFVTGFGLTASEGEADTFPEQLQGGFVDIMDNRNCERRFQDVSSLVEITENMLCAGMDLGGIDTCQGDSGGPLAVQGDDGAWRLEGVVSFGRGCGISGYPGVYTRTSGLVEWIQLYI